MLSGVMSGNNPFGSDFDDDTSTRQQEVIVKEGFLCPVCVRDCRTITELREHFETAHQSESSGYGGSASSQSSLISSQLKGLFNKTKKILTIDARDVSYDESNDSMASNFNNSGVIFISQWRHQMTIGPTRSHFDHFRHIRDSRIERYVVETNKLLIRLDKLISDAPTDPEKRKIHEKRVVFWANDNDVKLCPNCAKSFNLSRRRHHCRLCGGIMCHNCSQFLDFAYARKLVSPSDLEASSLALLPKPVSSLTRRGSSSSLLSMINSSGDPHIRVCKECKLLLDKRDQQIEDNLSNPIIYQMYDRMRQHVLEIQKLTPLYNQMCESLSIGETNYSLRDAQELRIKITKLGESVDIISTKISKLGTEDIETVFHSKQYKLQTAIRSAMVTFLRETMLGLPTLPSQEEVTKLQEQRRLEIEKRIFYEKQMALEEQSRSSSSSPQIRTQSKKLVTNNNNSEDDFTIISPDYGWAPEVSHKRNASADHAVIDPMLQQIKIIQNYIKQAREAHKYDEVYMLEENLKELEIEYLMQEHGLQDDERQSNTSHNQLK